MAFLSGFASGDPRNVAPGRQQKEYETKIFFNVERVFEYCRCFLVPHGSISEEVPPIYITVVHFVDGSTESLMLELADPQARSPSKQL